MKNMIHIGWAYLRYYRKQTAALLLGVLLSSALLAGMGGLFESGKNAALENARMEYGDWHYSTRGDHEWCKEFEKDPSGKGYQLEKVGHETVRKMIEEPFPIQFVYADDDYLSMMGRKIEEGYYPKNEDEIAMDLQTLKSLGITTGLGSQVILDGETFTLCGILTDMPEKLPEFLGNAMQVFVNDTLDYGMNGTFLYLKFDESHRVYDQLEALIKRFGTDGENFARNNGIAGYVGGEAPSLALEIIKTGISHKEAGLPYIWGQLNDEGGLTESVILLAVAFFGAFIIYSLFQISVCRRMSQYSIMQTLGMTDGSAFGILMVELSCVVLAGYPAGCVIGNIVSWLIYQKIGRIFIMQKQNYHSGAADQIQEYAVSNLPDAGNYCISWHTIAWGGMFLVVAMVVISLLLIRRMRRMTIRQLLMKDMGKRVNRKIYSIRHSNMTEILTRRFMFDRKGTFIGIVLSLSIGSIIFLGAFYVTENTRTNNELTYKADDGLGSDIQVYEQSDQLTDAIPENLVRQMKEIPGISELHPVRYLLGEIPLDDGKLLWKPFFADVAEDESNPPDPELQEKYNGIAVQTGEDDYTLKVNIYGYDDEMLEELNDYLLEGEIDPEQMKRDNSVIVKVLMDGQGNYGGIDIGLGDEVPATTVSSMDVPQEALRFQGSKEWYQSQKLKVSALTSRPLAKVDTYIGDNGTDAVDIIMTNEQMEKNFGVTDYQTVSISVAQETEADEVSDALGKITSSVRKCVVKDYSRQIAAQNLYLTQKMFFYYGIAAVLLGLSLLHIMNSMQYLIIARKREFGILRAMGITDAGFRKMIAREGLRYGIYSSVMVVAVYFFIQKVLYYFMIHVYLYLHPKAWISWEALAVVILMNIVICVGVTLRTGKTVLEEQIIEEIRE
ncbi:FtsX-like permease family protein [Bariatricus sp. SGI.154]|uniref:ABC transporter permease n=1 Tax=Bariatricus sp. SGI.154 TaxID=3420549 RepID=UPI003D00FCD3